MSLKETGGRRHRNTEEGGPRGEGGRAWSGAASNQGCAPGRPAKPAIERGPRRAGKGPCVVLHPHKLHTSQSAKHFSIHSLPGPGREVFSHSVSLLSSTSCLRCSREQHEPQHRKDLAPWTGQRWVPSGAGTAVVTSVNLVLDQATEITRLTWGLTAWAPSPSGRGTVLASRITESTF